MRATVESYDYIIVGAGTAGCILADSLTKDSDVRVHLLEAGDWERDFRIAIPLAWSSLLGSARHVWSYDSDAHDASKTRKMLSGRLVGGSSSINALSYVRGHRTDYDRWARLGLPQFSFDRVLPYFRRQESWEDGATAYRGDKGPLRVVRATLPDPIVPALMEAAEAQGFRTNIDYNGAEQAGFGFSQLMTEKGRRVSTTSAFLQPALRRGRVTLNTRALVTRIVIQHGRAIGVEFRHGSELMRAVASREVIVAAGAIQSPLLLNLSGIGNPDHLREVGIPVQAVLRGVGQNLRNHVLAGLHFVRRSPGAIHRILRADRLARSSLDWAFNRDSLLASSANAVMGFIETSQSQGVPDIQTLLLATSVTAQPYLPILQSPYEDRFSLNAVLLRPTSTGTIRLRTQNPEDKPDIRQNLLSTASDRKTLSEGLLMLDELAHQKPIAQLASRPLYAKAGRLSAVGLQEMLSTARPLYHQSGTCRIGPPGDELAVVDPQFRVKAIEGLRVVDASVMPDLIGGNPFACVAILAEMASEIIRVGRTAH